MNWSRGLLRVWLVASLAWVAILVFALGTPERITQVLTTKPFPTDITPAEVVVFDDQPGIVVARYGDLRFEAQTGGVTRDMTVQWERMVNAIAGEMNKDAALRNATRRAQIVRVRSDLLLAVSVPLAFLLGGAAIFWALRGFRKSGA